jgi:hypothetical protein
LRRKTVLNKEQDYNDNPDCQNCPYFINKLVCPFHRKKVAEGRESNDSGKSERKNEWGISITEYQFVHESEI